MINEAQIANLLSARFSSVAQVGPSVYRASQTFADKHYAIRYFDLSGSIDQAARNLREYQESLLSQTYFGESYPSHLRWNHYLYFIADNVQADTKEFLKLKNLIESDRTYARKSVMSESDLRSFLTARQSDQELPPTDISAQWTSELDKYGISFILDEAISAPQAARDIKDRKKHAPARQATPAALSDAEVAAGKLFLRAVSIKNFRAYPTEDSFNFGRVNLIHGYNGAGKTSLLEAIEFLYCGDVRRQDDLLTSTTISGEFYGSPLTLSTTGKQTPNLRDRNLHWYSKADVRKSTLADSFGKFNFLDTDAAVDLSNSDNGEDRLRTDIARLLFGAEADKLAKRLTMVKDRLSELIRDTNKDVSNDRQSLFSAKARLESLKNSPKNSDTLFSSLSDSLSRVGWRNILLDTKTIDHVFAQLQRSLIASRHVTRSKLIGGRRSIIDIEKYHSEIKSSLANAIYCNDRIGELQASFHDNQKAIKGAQARLHSAEQLVRVRASGLPHLISTLQELRTSASSRATRLSTLGDALIDLGEFGESSDADMLLSESKNLVARATEDQELLVADKAMAVKALEATMASAAVLRQRLYSAAKELLQKATNPNHCPVCQTAFEAGELELRISTLTADSTSDDLLIAQSELSKATELLTSLKIRRSALNSLAVFFGESSSVSIGDSRRQVLLEKSTLDDERLRISEVERSISQLASDGLTEALLGRLLIELSLGHSPSDEEIAEVINALKRDLATYVTAAESLDKEIKSQWAKLSTISGLPSSPPNDRPDAHVKIIGERLADSEKLFLSLKTLDENIRYSFEHAPEIEGKIEEAVDQTQRLITALSEEAYATSSEAKESENILRLEGSINSHTEELTAMESASLVIKGLLERSNEGEFTNKVLHDNAASIGEIFSTIHSPREFSVHANEAGSISIVRDGTSKNASLKQMSTGQRSAYALSLFLSMNRSLRNGPPIVLLDDPIAHIDDLNILSFLDYLRDLAVGGTRQIFFATADDKLAGLFRQKFRFLGDELFRDIRLTRGA